MAERKPKRAVSANALDLLIREILFAYFRLNASGERMFAPLGQTPGKVSLMRSLLEGPQSVAQIARARPVARQAVRKLVHEAMAEELAWAGKLARLFSEREVAIARDVVVRLTRAVVEADART